jgi:hypothetical protein
MSLLYLLLGQPGKHTWTWNLLVFESSEVSSQVGTHVVGGCGTNLGEGLIMWAVSTWARAQAFPVGHAQEQAYGYRSSRACTLAP